MHHRTLLLLLASIAFGATLLAALPGAAGAEEADTVLFLHWVNDSEPSRDLGGHSVRNFLDTTQEFEPQNRSVTSGSKWEEDWYLHPLLAEDLTTDNVTLGLWMNASGGQKRAQISVSLLDVADAASDPYGTTVSEANYGNTPLFATPHFMTFSLDFPAYTFGAGHSIRVLISMTPGTSTFVTIVWDTPTADSRVIVRTADRLSIDEAGVRDADGEPTTGLDPLAEDKGVTLYAVASDPLGIYDVADVRATLEGPDDEILVDNESMERPALPRGTSPAEFSLAWSHEGAETGRYTLTIWAVDLSGVSYLGHFGHGTYGTYAVLASSQFTIGEVFQVNVLCLDGGERPVEGALVSPGPRATSMATDEEGRLGLEVLGGTVTLTATWQGVQVGSLTLDVDADIPASDPAVIECAIYDVTLRVVDGRGDPLEDASVQVVPPAGDADPHPVRTDGTGLVPLGLVPGADHGVLVHWLGYLVADTTFLPEADGTINVACSVHWADFHVTDADGDPLPSVQLVTLDQVTLGVVGFGTTDGSGDLSLRLPDIAYRVEVYWRNTLVRQREDVSLGGGDMDLTIACLVFRAEVEVTDRDGSSLESVPVTLEDDTGAVVVTAITDDEGLVTFQVGIGEYRATAYLRTTHRWTEVHMEESARLNVTESGKWTLEFADYPPSIFSTLQFWSALVLLVMLFLVLYMARLYTRATRPPRVSESLEEDEEDPPEEDKDKDVP